MFVFLLDFKEEVFKIVEFIEFVIGWEFVNGLFESGGIDNFDIFVDLVIVGLFVIFLFEEIIGENV